MEPRIGQKIRNDGKNGLIYGVTEFNVKAVFGGSDVLFSIPKTLLEWSNRHDAWIVTA